MPQSLPWDMLGEMLTSTTVNINKRIALAEEQRDLYVEMAERLQNTIEILKRKKEEGENA